MTGCCHAAIEASTPFIMTIRFQEASMQKMPRLFALLAFAALAATGVRAEWPDHPVRWIVPFAPGGANDLIARAAADGVSKRIGQPVVVENKPGAGTIVGS